MKVSKKHIKYDFERFKETAQKAFLNNDIKTCLNLIELSSQIAYHLNFCYHDSDLEDLLSKISKRINNCVAGNTKENRFVFYDYFGWDNKGLTQQYVNALISWNYEFMFVFENTPKENSSKHLLKELENYDKATILYVDNKLSTIEKIQFISNKINEYQPQKAFLHLAPWSVTGVCVWNILQHIERYLINLTDHAFWLGTECIDYCIEFRDYGYNISKKLRNIPEQKLLIQPYYPVINNVDFQGFPVETENKIVIVSAGVYYKVFSEDDKFFIMLSKITSQFPEVIIFFAGDGDRKLFKLLLAKYKIEDKVILLGNRSDIAQVISNSDIYLGTYPFGGGLLTQYAAILGVPVIAYNEIGNDFNRLEDLLLIKNIKLCYYSISDLLDELEKLINNKDYRKKQSDKIKTGIIQPDEFNKSLKSLITSNTNINKVEDIPINVDDIHNLYLSSENKYLKQYFPMIYNGMAVCKKYNLKFFIRNMFFCFIDNPKMFVIKIFKHILKP